MSVAAQPSPLAALAEPQRKHASLWRDAWRRFFKNKLGITFDGEKTHQYADMMTTSRPLSEQEKLVIQGYVDEFYEWAFIGPCKQLGAQLWSFDTWVVDGMVNGAARVTLIWAELMHWVDEYLVDGAVDLTEYIVHETSDVFRGLQSGRVQHYAFVMFLGFLAFAVVKFLV